jgi:hypothetical protein
MHKKLAFELVALRGCSSPGRRLPHHLQHADLACAYDDTRSASKPRVYRLMCYMPPMQLGTCG